MNGRKISPLTDRRITLSFTNVRLPLPQTMDHKTATMDRLLGFKKPRLYVALYALGGALRQKNPSGEQDYYWAFIIAPKEVPKDKKCIRYRIQASAGWEKLNPGKVEFEKVEWKNDKRLVPLGRHDDIVARVLIAKIEDAEAVDEVRTIFAAIFSIRTLSLPDALRGGSERERAFALPGSLVRSRRFLGLEEANADFRIGPLAYTARVAGEDDAREAFGQAADVKGLDAKSPRGVGRSVAHLAEWDQVHGIWEAGGLEDDRELLHDFRQEGGGGKREP